MWPRSSSAEKIGKFQLIEVCCILRQALVWDVLTTCGVAEEVKKFIVLLVSAVETLAEEVCPVLSACL